MTGLNYGLISGGVAVGAIFAAVVQNYRLCLVGGASSAMLIRDFRQINVFVSAWLVAIIGTQLLEITNFVPVAESSYRNDQIDWLGALLGGLLFGIGATLSGGCAARTVVRAMEGSIYSLTTLFFFMLAAAITQFGFLEPVRLQLLRATSINITTDAGLASILMLPPGLVLIVVVVLLLALLYRGWQYSPGMSNLWVGAVTGLLVVVGWLITGVLATDEFAVIKPASMTLSGPLARFGYYLMSARVPEFTYAIAFATGMMAGALFTALGNRQFKVTMPNAGTIKYAIIGGLLMGAGATFAHGCNIGQGMTGVSTLSLESIIAVTGIVAGIAATTKWMELRTE